MRVHRNCLLATVRSFHTPYCALPTTSMFSKTTCGYCANAKRLLSKHTGNVVVLELDQLGTVRSRPQATLPCMRGVHHLATVWPCAQVLRTCSTCRADS